MPTRHVSSRQILLTVLACACLYLALVLPSRPDWITPGALLFFPLEAMVIGLCLLVPGAAGRAGLWVLSALLGLSLVLRIADLITWQVFDRAFSPVFDLYLLADGMRLLTGAVGRLLALVLAGLLALFTLSLFWLAFVLLRRLRHDERAAPRVSLLVLGVLMLAWGGLRAAGWPRADSFVADELVHHVQDTLVSLADLEAFKETVDEDVFATVPAGRLFTALEGKDVFVIFAESYGRNVLDSNNEGPDIRATLAEAGQTLSEHGLLVRSAFLSSPTVGGQSWLAHGTLLSGLWIDSGIRYESLLMSERPTLNALFRRAGWRTVAAMPGISAPWPEGDYFGYEHLYDAHTFGYAGLPFNWVTMPDQYVLSALQARERKPGRRQPVMAEVALISSHAPWTPIPTLVPWSTVGDGQVFDEQASAGPTPQEVWSDNARIRNHYHQAIDYMLRTVVDYAVHYGDDDLVLVVLGDHQPAPLVTGQTGNVDVPVHLIARDPAVIAALEGWQWQIGLLPGEEAPVWRMDTFRDRFITAFSPRLHAP